MAAVLVVSIMVPRARFTLWAGALRGGSFVLMPHNAAHMLVSGEELFARDHAIVVGVDLVEEAVEPRGAIGRIKLAIVVGIQPVEQLLGALLGLGAGGHVIMPNGGVGQRGTGHQGGDTGNHERDIFHRGSPRGGRGKPAKEAESRATPLAL